MSEEELLTLAAALEKRSEHPLARAVLEKAAGMELPETTGFEALPGNGLRAFLGGSELIAGNLAFIGSAAETDPVLTERARELAGEGKTPLFFARDGKLIGVIAVADTIKEDSARAVAELKGMGIKAVMLTGDNERTAAAIGAQAGVDDVAAGILPDGKAREIERLRRFGRVVMVGDGINDAPALTAADAGIAIGAGTDIAIDAADVVVMKSRLTDITAAIRIGRATVKNIHQNLFWAFFYNAVCIPLAMGLYGIAMKPVYGAAAMALSSFFVCMNALRLNLLKVHDAVHDKPIKNKAAAAFTAGGAKREENKVTKTIKIDGMMCEHCEARVKKALEAVSGVESAEADREKKQAVVKLSKDVPGDVLAKAVEAQDYTVLGVE